MNKIYFSIVILALYGDLLKRYLPAKVALGSLYAAAIIIIFLLVLLTYKKQNPAKSNSESRIIARCVYLLIVIYVFQFLLISNDIPLIECITGLIYPCTPLVYCIVVLKIGANFNLVRLSHIFHILMIPINIVGAIQYTVDSNFMVISTETYTGIKLRTGQFGLETYARLPALFASADRYSAIGLMQFYFAFILLLSPVKKSRAYIAWISFNLISGIAALLIAGARSRILTVQFIVILVLVMTLFNCFSRPQQLENLINKLNIVFKKSFFYLIIIGCLLALLTAYNNYYVTSTIDFISHFPVIQHIQKSAAAGDVELRLSQAAEVSLLPQDISLFGKGIGANWVQGSQEFGIRAIWSESGLLGGTFILLVFSAIVLVLGIITLRAFFAGQILMLITFTLPMLVIITALLTGLTVMYELSSGILLWTSLGSIMKYSSGNRSLH